MIKAPFDISLILPSLEEGSVLVGTMVENCLSFFLELLLQCCRRGRRCALRKMLSAVTVSDLSH